MEELLIYFAIPLATIIISIALQKILKCPVLVALVIFSIYLIVTFVLSELIYLIATIIYTIIAYIVAYITNIVINRNSCNQNTSCSLNNCRRTGR